MHAAPQEQMLQDTNPSGIKVRTVDVRTLNPHPRNSDFFEDENDEKWEELVESIKSNGLHNPILITPDGTIVSGHRRVRACKELQIWNVPANVKYFANEDDVLKALIESNTVQRGTIVNQSKRKQVAIIIELERLYKIQQGGGRKSDKTIASNETINFDDPRTQTDLAEKLGVSRAQYQRLKSLSNLPEELLNILETNGISMELALKVATQTSKSDQVDLLQNLLALPGNKENYKALIQEEVKKALQAHDSSMAETNKQLQRDLEEAQRKADEERVKNNKLRLEKIRMEEELATSQAMLAERPQEMENMEETNRQLFNQLTDERNGRKMLEQSNRHLKEQLESKNIAIEKILAFRVSISNAISALKDFYQNTSIEEEYKASMQQELALARHSIEQFVAE